MSNIIIPGRSNATLGEQRFSIEWTSNDVHPTLAQDLSLNEHLFRPYVEAIQKAVGDSLNDPDTRPREITAALIKERVHQAHAALLVLREDLKFSLRRCIDILPKAFMEALKADLRTEDLVEKNEAPNPSAWGREAEPMALKYAGEVNDDAAAAPNPAVEDAAARLAQDSEGLELPDR